MEISDAAKQQRIEGTAKRIADAQRARDPGPSDEDLWWASVLSDPRAETARPVPAKSLRLSPDGVRCLRSFKVVEELRRDLIARWGASTTWREAGQRLLDERCEHRTGSHEDDGCWPDFRC